MTDEVVQLEEENLDLDSFLSYVEESEMVCFDELAMSPREDGVKGFESVSESDSDVLSKGNPQEESQKRGVSGQQKPRSKAKRDRTNAARCKRHREKQKFLKEQVYVDNKELKKERVALLKEISDLQLEVDSLRCKGLIDLSKENELLRAAIESHQKYINQIVQVALKAPEEVDSAEHTRLMKAGLENAARHIIGLAYGSIHSDLWKQAKPFPFHLDDGTTLDNIRVWYQFLPLGVPRSEARRVNIRYDIPPLPLEWRKLAAAHWKVTSKVDILQEQINGVERLKHLKVREITPVTKLSETEEMTCLAISNENKKGLQNLFVVAIKDAEMHSTAFLNSDAYGDSDTVPVRLVAGSSCSTELKPAGSVEKIVVDLNPDGFIYREAGEGQCAITITSSSPLSGEYYEMVLGSVLKGEPMISEEGELHDIFKHSTGKQLSNIIRHYEV